MTSTIADDFSLFINGFQLFVCNLPVFVPRKQRNSFKVTPYSYLARGDWIFFFFNLLITLLNIAIMQYYKIQIQDINTNT